MWILDEWMREVRAHLTDYDKELGEVSYDELESLFDQGFSPSEALLYFIEN